MVILFYVWIFLSYWGQEVVSYCSLPEQFQNSVWVDSDKGELTFSTLNMTGWGLQIKNGITTYNQWECFRTSTDGSKLYLIMINKQNITLLGEDFTTYLCMEITPITSRSYYYYLLWAEQEQWGFQRISTTRATTLVSDPLQQLCFSKNNDSQAAHFPDTGEYHLLIKEGYEQDAKQECPSTFFGEYSYKVTNKETNTDYCGTGNEVWNVCTDYHHMTFNYTICDTKIAYSDNGSVFCLFSLTSGSYTYQTLYNEDATVNMLNDIYRFTCMVSSQSFDGSLNVSQTPGSCKKGQTPNDQPVFADSSSVGGLNMILTPRKLCHKQDDQTQGSKGLSFEAIAGIVVGILIFTVILIVIIVVCLKVRFLRKRRTSKQQATLLSAHVKSNIVSDDIVNAQPISRNNNGKPYVKDDIQTKNSSLNVNAEQVKSDVNTETQIRQLQKYDENLDNFTLFEMNQSNQTMSDQTRNADFNGHFRRRVLREDKDKCNSSGIGNNAFVEKYVKEEKIADDMVEILEANGSNIPENKNDEVFVTRLTENEIPLRKSMQHLNSTENIFYEHDVAMSFKTNDYSISKSDVNVRINCLENQNDRKNAFEYSRDDSGLNLKSVDKLRNKKESNERFNKSEGNLIAAVKSVNLNRSSTKISGFSNNPLEWNFVYRSPYALSDIQKQEIIDRKVKMQKRKVQLEKRKQKEKVKKNQENQLAFEKWKQNKKKETTMKNNSLENDFGKIRNTYWYPT